MSSRSTSRLAVVLLCIATMPLHACEIRVRDSAFRMARDTHRLCVISDSSDSQAGEIHRRLSEWLDQTTGDMNLRIERIDADDPETNWSALGIPSQPPSLPVTVLIGRNNGVGEHFIVDHWEPSPTDEDLAAMVDSPVRKRLARELAVNVAVLVFAPRDPDAQSAVTGRLESLIQAGIADERIGLSMITVDRYDPAERLLCRFMGLRPDSPDTLCVAFGRGKLMSPPLVGEEINAASIETLVTTIRQACSCSKPLATMGVDLPLIWSAEVDSTVILMDEELDLSELDEEIENMLSGKASIDESDQPTVVAIPAGRQPAAAGQASDSASAASAELVTIGAAQANVATGSGHRVAMIAVGSFTLVLAWLGLLFVRRRTSELHD